MEAARMGKPVYATFSTWVTPTVAINRGEAWDPDDPVVLSHPDWFSAEPPDVRRSDTSMSGSPTVEQATAAPGEKRATTAPRRGPGRPRKDADDSE